MTEQSSTDSSCKGQCGIHALADCSVGQHMQSISIIGLMSMRYEIRHASSSHIAVVKYPVNAIEIRSSNIFTPDRVMVALAVNTGGLPAA